MRKLPHEKIEQLDLELVELTRGLSRIRLELGVCLETMVWRGGHHELGFSSIENYVLERCGRSRRWSTETRTLARRLARLPVLRRAVTSGAIGWCMAELLARHAKPDNEVELVEKAQRSTVRAMRQLLKATQDGVDAAEPDGQEELEMCSLRVTAGQADIWLFEWTRRFFEHLHGGEGRTEDFMSALLAEAHSSLCGALPRNAFDIFIEGDARRERLTAQEAAWRAQLAEWREESERRCEPNFFERHLEWIGALMALAPDPEACVSAPEGSVEPVLALDDLDTRIAELADRLALSDLELSRLARSFHETEGWRRLGYSTPQQYARERLGVSPSTLKSRVALARRLLSAVRRALESGEICYEAALLISRVATVETVVAWVDLAKRRTVKHLAEEVRAAELVRTLSNDVGVVEPPSDEVLRELRAIEGQILIGNRRALAESQMSAHLGPDVTSACVNLRVTRDTALYYRQLEAIVRPYLPRTRSFLALLCDLFWDAWKHEGKRVYEHKDIFTRDGFRCANPVCKHRGVQPHHVQFRAHGGGDEPENLLSLCHWCHLEGVHLGRMRIVGPASKPRFELGRKTWLIIDNRERKRVGPGTERVA